MKCLLTPRGASTACVCSPQQPAGSTAAKPAKSAMQWAEPMAFLPHHLSQPWQGAKAPAFSVAPCPLHPWQMLPRRHHIKASLPSSASNGLQGLPGPTVQNDFTCPPPTAEHLEPAVAPEWAELRLPSHTECCPLHGEQQQLSRLRMAWPPTTGCGVAHYPSTRMAGVTMISTSLRIKL